MKPYWSNDSGELYQGDVLEVLAALEAGSAHMAVCSPPYWGLRRYLPEGHPDEPLQIGLEKTPQEWVDKMVAVGDGLWRVLREDATWFLNVGDSYASVFKGSGGPSEKQLSNVGSFYSGTQRLNHGLKPKDLCLMPFRLALALQEAREEPSCVKSAIDRAWLAAMMDGEGTIGIRRFDSYREERGAVYQDGFVVYTAIANNDVELLDRCVQITGLGKARVKNKAGVVDSRGIAAKRDCYGWRLDGNGAVDVIRACYPYLIAKKKQACIAYTLDVLNKAGKEARGWQKPVPPELQEKRRLCWEMVKKCNQREPVDLPSWIEEPKPKSRPGWYVRSDICWAKKSPMPESVTDRPTSAWEHIFLLSKQAKYFYDAEAVREPDKGTQHHRNVTSGAPSLEPSGGLKPAHGSLWGTPEKNGQGANLRNVWHLGPENYPEAHFATFPSEVPRRCVKAGTSEKGCCAECGAPWVRVVEKVSLNPWEHRAKAGAGKGTKERGYNENHGNEMSHDLGCRTTTTGWQPSCSCDAGDPVPATVLEPFCGSGTTCAVAQNLRRRWVGIELNAEYCDLAINRITTQAAQRILAL